MQTLSTDACNNFISSHLQFLGFRPQTFFRSSSSPTPVSLPNRILAFPCISCTFNGRNQNPRRGDVHGAGGGGRGRPNAKGKDNVWSVDNDAAAMALRERERTAKKRRRGRRVRTVKKKSKGDMVMVSGAMLMEVETVLQTQVFWCIYLFILKILCLDGGKMRENDCLAIMF